MNRYKTVREQVLRTLLAAELPPKTRANLLRELAAVQAAQKQRKRERKTAVANGDVADKRYKKERQ